eukprot:TRINITY_DN9108_c0_g1_i1.p1 TRINITY_DN9108_c0_g1~~TRINITY_DN9108_c0_g1_i1.p1  ORF type:complete len:531 (+),score=66.73 TRINITY_DN9108_c0_g1_i1:110-1702(+)
MTNVDFPSVLKISEDERKTKCHICGETGDLSVCTPCQWSYCKKCSEAVKEETDDSDDDESTCPRCKTRILVPDGSYMLRIIDTHPALLKEHGIAYGTTILSIAQDVSGVYLGIDQLGNRSWIQAGKDHYEPFTLKIFRRDLQGNKLPTELIIRNPYNQKEPPFRKAGDIVSPGSIMKVVNRMARFSFSNIPRAVAPKADRPTAWPTFKQVQLLHEKPDPQGYKRVQIVGEGAVGVVYGAKRISDDRFFAIKDVTVEQTGDSEELKEMAKRAAIHKDSDLEGFYIVKYHDVYTWEKDGKEIVSIVMDYSGEGDLVSHLRRTSSLEEMFVIEVALQMLSALEHMHTHDPPYLHMDVKPENILVFDDACTFKLTDFDAMRRLDQKGIKAFQRTTEEYRAPEVEDEIFTPAADVFSLGVVLFVLVALPDFPMLEDTMFNHEHWKDPEVLRKAMIECIEPRAYLVEDEDEISYQRYTNEIIEIITSMLYFDYKLRPSCADLVVKFESLRDGILSRSIVPESVPIDDIDFGEAEDG